ncbi:MAG: arginine repressor [Bacteroidales bacterium]|nr:arginine repressor [Bacteroidales bacterium]MDT8430343.1 arginine repressor [Bacteroidales bacterium]
MRDRNERLMAIRRLINGSNISSQEELQDQLERQGFSMTQATLSRDLKYLKVAKMPDSEKGYIYMLTERQLNDPSENEDIPITGFVSIDYAQGMAIMKTLPGHASSIAYALDNLNSYEIAGTIAGDDTILVIPRDGVTKGDLTNLLKTKMPGFRREEVH